MTAIAGLIRLDGASVDRAALERMQALLTPYGRDAQQRWQQGPAGLLRTLLRTTPEDSLDHQPLQDAASQTVLVFDGRIDNRDELARELGLGTAELARMADSALVLQACLRWDTGAAARLLGDFALACWQPQRRRLWLARDPMGQRPLFWHRHAGLFAFATMPKALFVIPGVPRALCEARLLDLLCLLPMTGPESFYQEVFRVEPGQWLLLEGDRLSTQRYHAFDPDFELAGSSDAEVLEGFAGQLERAVACRLRSNGPVASHLSSGFDSSTVTALAARQLAARGRRLRAYTAVPREGYDGPVPRGRHADEGPAAAALAARFANIDHVLIRSAGRSPLDALQADIEALDRAPLNPCNMVWLDAITADAEVRGVRVMLSGQLGNMSISYDGAQRLPALLRQGDLAAWWREASALHSHPPGRRWPGLLAQSLAPFLPVWLWILLRRYRGQPVRLTDGKAVHPDFLRRGDAAGRARRAGWGVAQRRWSDGRRMRIAVLGRVDPGEHMAAANLSGLELRDPTADSRLFAYCLSLPEHLFLRGGQTRWMLRRLMAGVLPPEILDARTHGLQAADWHEGFAAALPQIREALEGLVRHGGPGAYVDLPGLLQSLDGWPSVDLRSQRATVDFRMKLLRGLAAASFVRHVDPRNG
jgi:asparagine synthase (glutamine-hydrolysing)